MKMIEDILIWEQDSRRYIRFEYPFAYRGMNFNDNKTRNWIW